VVDVVELTVTLVVVEGVVVELVDDVDDVVVLLLVTVLEVEVDVVDEVVVVVVVMTQVDSPISMVISAIGANAALYENGMSSSDSLMLKATFVMSASRFSVWFLLGYRFPTLMYCPLKGTRHGRSVL